MSTVLETLVVYACPVVIGRDFNVQVQDADDPDACRLADLLASFDLVQLSGPTHRCGNTLDLIITPALCQLDSVIVDPAGMLSDHSLVICRLPVDVERASVFEQQARGWRRALSTPRIYVAYWKRANCASQYPPMLTLICLFDTGYQYDDVSTSRLPSWFSSA